MSAIGSVSLANHLKEMRPGDTLLGLSFELTDVQGTRILLKNSTILCRERHSSKKDPGKVKQPGYRFEVFNDTSPLATGCEGKICSIDATLALNKSGKIVILTKENKQRIIKIVRAGARSRPDDDRETLIGSTVSYLHMKPIIIPNSSNNEVAHYIIMHRVKGKTLGQTIKDGEVEHLNRKNRVLLLLNALKAIKELHQRGIVHRDLHTNNIMVNFEEGSSEPQLSIIDFGLSKPASEKESIRADECEDDWFQITKALVGCLPGLTCEMCHSGIDSELFRIFNSTLRWGGHIELGILIDKIEGFYSGLLENKETTLSNTCQSCETKLEMLSHHRDLDKEKAIVSKMSDYRNKLLLSKKDPNTAKNKAESLSKIINSFGEIKNNLSPELIAKIRGDISQENETLRIHRHSCTITPFLHILCFFKPTMLDKRVDSIKLTADLDSYLNSLEESWKDNIKP
ncbi:MAG: protein kinase [Pseudomonadota bacterium]